MSVYMADDDQLKELMKYISDHLQMPLLGFGGGAEFVVGDPWFHDVAIGTVIPGWLYADGSTYNIADYPQLAAHYASHHGRSNFYGGDGVTTFAVPDLRGEFMRGSGTNGHTNQGSGAEPGVHQDATEFSVIGRWNSGAGVTNPSYLNEDIIKAKTGSFNYQQLTRNEEGGLTSERMFISSHPTNTSFPVYIKATMGHTYSEIEQLVGTDEDGNYVYEKTIRVTGSINGTAKSIANIANIRQLRKYFGVISSDNNTIDICIPDMSIRVYRDGTTIYIVSDGDTFSNDNGAKVTIQYTKTQS